MCVYLVYLVFCVCESKVVLWLFVSLTQFLSSLFPLPITYKIKTVFVTSTARILLCYLSSAEEMSMMDIHCDTVDECLGEIEIMMMDHTQCDKVEARLVDVSDTLDQMKMELHSVKSQAAKEHYNSRIRAFHARIGVVRKTVLFAGASSSSSYVAGTKGCVQTIEQKQQVSLNILRQANKQLAQSEQLGLETISNLQGQGEQIQGTTRKVEDVNNHLSHAQKLLNKMSRWWR